MNPTLLNLSHLSFPGFFHGTEELIGDPLFLNQCEKRSSGDSIIEITGHPLPY